MAWTVKFTEDSDKQDVGTITCTFDDGSGFTYTESKRSHNLGGPLNGWPDDVKAWAQGLNARKDARATAAARESQVASKIETFLNR